MQCATTLIFLDNNAQNDSKEEINPEMNKNAEQNTFDENEDHKSKTQSNADSETNKQQPMKKDETNPQRSLGDAKKQWDRRLNAEDRKELENAKESEQDQNAEDEEQKGKVQYEFVEDNEKEDAQTLANATEDQLKSWENQEDFMNKENEPEVPEVDENLAENGKDKDLEKENDKNSDSNVNPKPSKLKQPQKSDQAIDGEDTEGVLNEKDMDVNEEGKELMTVDFISKSKLSLDDINIEEEYKELNEEGMKIYFSHHKTLFILLLKIRNIFLQPF